MWLLLSSLFGMADWGNDMASKVTQVQTLQHISLIDNMVGVC